VRMHITTSEGGSIDDEFVFRYAVDRVETTSTVWMGLTTGCAVCHDHKFDPISQKEFYQLYAFFNNTREAVMDGNKPYQSGVDLQIPTAEQTEQMAQYAAETAAIEQEIKDALAKVSYEDPEADLPEGELARQELVWIDDALPAGAVGEGDPPGPWNFVGASEGPVHGGQKSSTRTATGRSQHYFTGANPALEVGPGDVLFCHVYLDPDNPPREIMFQWNDGTWEHRAFWGENVIDWGTDGTAGRLPMGPLPEAGKWVRLEVEAAKVNLPPGAKINGWAFTQFDGTVHWDTAGIVTQTPQQSVDSLAVWEKLQRAGDVNKSKLPEPVKAALRAEPDKQTPEQRKVVRDYFLENIFPGTREMFDPLHGRIAEVKKKNAELEKQIPWTLIASERPGNQTRQAFVRQRGDYDKPTGDPLQRAVPAVLPPLAEGAPKNRLGLARWLVDPKHPLTARVTVNRFWQQYFGTGIVKTAEDFGSQGEWPSHPELLDWLAVEFVESGWDTKAMQRRIVTSATYRQSSKIKPIHLEKDRDNRLLARGPRFRMDAEMVRDNALAVSGLLVEKLGGPSVKPYQPSGLWKAVGYSSSNTANFKADQGDALYRRGLYTFWKRTSPPPTMLLLDAPSRETCTVRRERTNTPLAALALLNDVQFFECARNLAQRMMLQGGDTPEQRIAFAFRLATARPPEADELDVLRRQYDEHLTYYQNDKEAAEKLLGFGESPRDESLDAGELAAWTIVANVILNLDETLTKQ